MSFVFAFTLMITFSVRSAVPKVATVATEHGQVSGTSYALTNGRVIDAFFGIPYAAPPIFKYRFKDPQPVQPWMGVWNASKPGSICLQYDHNAYDVVGEEDCLYLNVFTPELPAEGVSPLLDVIVYIHGGAFMFGAGSRNYPDYMMKSNDVVLVTLNYRLGPFGFFSTGDEIVPGNLGLKDQVAALKWVQHNIIRFGGNPGSVTITGLSAGGASVHYHYLSPLSSGLFQKGVSFSGTTLAPWTLPRNVTEKSTRLAQIVGCPIDNNRNMVKCLRRRPARQIVNTVELFFAWRYSSFSPFGPVVEPPHANAFLTETPQRLLNAGNFKKLPWLTSVTSEEGLYPAADFIGKPELLKELEENWVEIEPNLNHYNFSASESDKRKISSAVRKHYLKGKPVAEAIPELVRMIGDRSFYVDIARALEYQSKFSDAVYFYKFSYRGKYSLTNIYAGNEENYGVSHADDTQYWIKSFGNPEEDEKDVAMTDLMVGMITSFARTGKPSVGSVNFEPVSGGELNCLEIKSPEEVRMTNCDQSEALAFWKSVLPREYEGDEFDAKGEL